MALVRTTPSAVEHLERRLAALHLHSQHSVEIRYMGTRIVVEADTVDVPRHLEWVLGTHMAIEAPGGTSGAAAKVIASAFRVDASWLDFFHDAPDIEIFPLKDSPLAMFGKVLEADGRRWVWSRNTNSLIRIEGVGSPIVVLGPIPDLAVSNSLLGGSLEQAVLRIVRDILHFHEQMEGVVVSHAAAIDVEGSGLAIFGSRRGGKTTFVSKLLSGPQIRRMRFVSGDRILISEETRTLAAYGWPSFTNLGLATIISVRALHRLLPPVYRHALSQPLEPDEVHQKVLVSHRDYQQALGFEVVARTTLRAMVLLVPEATGLEPHSVEPAEAARRLIDNIVDLIETEEANWLGRPVLAPTERTARREALARRLVSEVAAYCVGTPDILSASLSALGRYVNVLIRNTA